MDGQNGIWVIRWSLGDTLLLLTFPLSIMRTGTIAILPYPHHPGWYLTTWAGRGQTNVQSTRLYRWWVWGFILEQILLWAERLDCPYVVHLWDIQIVSPFGSRTKLVTSSKPCDIKWTSPYWQLGAGLFYLFCYLENWVAVFIWVTGLVIFFYFAS